MIETDSNIVETWNKKQDASNLKLSGLVPFVNLISLFTAREMDVITKRADGGVDEDFIKRLKTYKIINDDSGTLSNGEKVNEVPIKGLLVGNPKSQLNTLNQSGGIGINSLNIIRGTKESLNIAYDMGLTIADAAEFDMKLELTNLVSLNSTFLIVYGWSGGEASDLDFVDPPNLSEPGENSEDQTIVIDMSIKAGTGFWKAQLVRLYKFEYDFDEHGFINARLGFMSTHGAMLAFMKMSSISKKIKDMLWDNKQPALPGEFIGPLGPDQGYSMREDVTGKPVKAANIVSVREKVKANMHIDLIWLEEKKRSYDNLPYEPPSEDMKKKFHKLVEDEGMDPRDAAEKLGIRPPPWPGVADEGPGAANLPRTPNTDDIKKYNAAVQAGVPKEKAARDLGIQIPNGGILNTDGTAGTNITYDLVTDMWSNNTPVAEAPPVTHPDVPSSNFVPDGASRDENNNLVFDSTDAANNYNNQVDASAPEYETKKAKRYFYLGWVLECIRSALNEGKKEGDLIPNFRYEWFGDNETVDNVYQKFYNPDYDEDEGPEIPEDGFSGRRDASEHIKSVFEIPIHLSAVAQFLDSKSNNWTVMESINALLNFGAESQGGSIAIPGLQLGMRVVDNEIEIMLLSVTDNGLSQEIRIKEEEDSITQDVAISVTYGAPGSLCHNIAMASKLDPGAFDTHKIRLEESGSVKDIISQASPGGRYETIQDDLQKLYGEIEEEITKHNKKIDDEIYILKYGGVNPDEDEPAHIKPMDDTPERTAMIENLESRKRVSSDGEDPTYTGQSFLNRYIAQDARNYSVVQRIVLEKEKIFASLLGIHLRRTTLSLHGTTDINVYEPIIVRGLVRGMKGIYTILGVTDQITKDSFVTQLECSLRDPLENI